MDSEINWNAIMPEVALRLLGEPKPKNRHRGNREWRYGNRESLSIDLPEARWYDHENKVGGGVVDLIVRERGGDRRAAMEWLEREGIVQICSANGGACAAPLGEVAAYDYEDEQGEVLFQVVRYEPKTFRQRRPDGQGGWQWNVQDVRRVLYRLPDLIEAIASERPVFVTEGEKDADNLRSKFGVAATTNAGGAGKWTPALSEHLKGADAILLPHNDAAGRAHMQALALKLQGIARRVRVVDIAKHWPACQPKGDVSDWIDLGGGTAEALWALADAAPVWTPPADEAPRPLMRELPPADPFPADALGGLLGDAARAIQDQVRAPFAMCAQSVLAAATLAVQGHANVVLPTGRARPLSSFFVSVGVSGERKTAVDHEATWPIRKRESALRERYDQELPAYTNAKLVWDKAREHVTKQHRGNPQAIRAALDVIGPAPVVPLAPMLTCTEPTYEGLFKAFAAAPPSLGIFDDEAGQFIGGHGMREESKLRTAAGLSKLWDGSAIDRVRGGDGIMILPGRRLAMHLMAQPGVAALFLADSQLAEQGLLSRVLVTDPESAIGNRMWRELSLESSAVVRRYGARLLDILETPAKLVDGKTNELAPRELPLSPEARAAWIAFHNEVESQIGAGGALEPICGLANKLPEHAARLAAVLTLVDNVNAVDIPATMMGAGIALAKHYAAEALRLFEAGLIDKELLLAQQALVWIREHGGIVGLPDLYQRGPNAIRTKAAATKVVAVLVEHGHLIPIEGGAVVAGNHRREAWRTWDHKL